MTDKLINIPLILINNLSPSVTFQNQENIRCITYVTLLSQNY